MDGTKTLEQLHLTFIRATPQAVWHALTSPEATRLFFHGLDVDSSFLPGSPIRYLSHGEEGEAAPVIVGSVLEADEDHHLAHTFAFTDSDDAPTKVEYDLEGLGDELTRLSVVHSGFEGETNTYTTTRTGWAPILSGLKTLLETGEPLAMPAPSETGPSH